MTTDILFQISNLVALISWLILIVFSKNQFVISYLKYAVVTTLCIAYLVLIIPNIHLFNPKSFSTLENILNMFKAKEALVAAWIHFLTFDLFVGIYIVETGNKKGISRWKYTLCLPVTFMFGPAGLLLFYIIKIPRAINSARI